MNEEETMTLKELTDSVKKIQQVLLSFDTDIAALGSEVFKIGVIDRFDEIVDCV